jgi:lysylphosphatidylglycerol synthetase-like protein (DUF2156 family)
MNPIESLNLMPAIGMLFDFDLMLSMATPARIWYAIPLVMVVSLVYGATRHEHLKEILIHSFRSAVWVLAFMAAIFALIWVAGFWN